MSPTWIVFLVVVVVMAIAAGIFFQPRNGQRDDTGSAADVPDAPHGEGHSDGSGGESGGSGSDGGGGGD